MASEHPMATSQVNEAHFLREEIEHLREVNAALVEALREIEAKARDLADDAMTNQRGLWLACANEARAALARATTQEQAP